MRNRGSIARELREARRDLSRLGMEASALEYSALCEIVERLETELKEYDISHGTWIGGGNDGT